MTMPVSAASSTRPSPWAARSSQSSAHVLSGLALSGATTTRPRWPPPVGLQRIDDAAVERMFAAIGPEATLERLAERGRASIASRPLPASAAEMGPDQAAHAIAELKSDSAFMAKWMSGDRIAAGRMSALQHEVAFPEAPTSGAE